MDRLQALVTACVLSLAVSATAVHAVSWIDGVGSRQLFNQSNSLDLATYCNGADLVDDTVCIDQWLYDQKTQGKDGYVSPGTYLVSYYYQAFSNMRIKCANPTTTVFKKMSGHNGIWGFDAEQVPGTVEPMEDVIIENCGFDLNGFLTESNGVLDFQGIAMPISHITLRGNRVFDSVLAPGMCTARDCQRGYFLLSNAQYVLIENNQLSEGGRIKVAFPAEWTVIRNNTLTNINDNAITIVDSSGYDTHTHDVLIEGNTIINPIGSGIFFGADGQLEGTLTMTLSDITIRNNSITGFFDTSCIQGTLPNNSTRIYIANNICQQSGAGPMGDSSNTTGITMSRAFNSPNDVTETTIVHNSIGSAVANRLSGAPLFIGDEFDNLCILDNTITNNTSNTVYFYGAATGKMAGNNLGGGSVRIDFPARVSLDTSGNRAGCYVAPALNPCYD